MSIEFTGERVVPGQVNDNLWNEHIARYAFASRLARSRRVLDMGCGSGYGTAELARHARRAAGVDISAEAVGFAREHFSSPNVGWIAASATALPLPDASFDLIVAFEVIEHLEDWRKLLSEARRLLAAGGQFVVSTPNKISYAETRGGAGPNPFHVHEFEFEEFHAVLREHFADVRMFLEDPTEGVLFQSLDTRGAAEVRIEKSAANPVSAHFFVAVCAMTNQTGAPAFVYLPASGGMLREHELHIQKLKSELEQKDDWLDAARTEHQELVQMFRRLQAELEERNQWARELNHRIEIARQRIEQLEEDEAAFQHVRDAYEAKIAELEADSHAKTEWAQATEHRLTSEINEYKAELARCAEALEQSQAVLSERTRWAQDLDRRCEQLEARLNLASASRWLRLGRVLGVGPELRRP